MVDRTLALTCLMVPHQRQPPLVGEIDGFGQKPRRFLRSMRAHGVFRVNEIQPKLRPALQQARLGKCFSRGRRCLVPHQPR